MIENGMRITSKMYDFNLNQVVVGYCVDGIQFHNPFQVYIAKSLPCQGIIELARNHLRGIDQFSQGAEINSDRFDLDLFAEWAYKGYAIAESIESANIQDVLSKTSSLCNKTEDIQTGVQLSTLTPLLKNSIGTGQYKYSDIFEVQEIGINRQYSYQDWKRIRIAPLNKVVLACMWIRLEERLTRSGTKVSGIEYSLGRSTVFS